MTAFVLVHGGYHGGWCWQPLVDELARRGHSSIAPDLPCDDPDAGYAEYVATVLHAMRKIAEQRQHDPDLNHQIHVLEQTLRG